MPSKAATPKKSKALLRRGPAKAVGGMANLQTRIDELEAELRASGTRLVDPADIRPSRFYNRFDLDTNPADEAFDQLIQSIRSQRGNVIPVLLTAERDKPGYEIVYGHRRVAACKVAGAKVLAFIKQDLDAKEIGRLRVLENSDRRSPSIIDRARQIASLLDLAVWESQAELADGIGITPPYVSMLLNIGRGIPAPQLMQLQMAHPDHHRISFRQAKAIAEVARRDLPELKRRIEWVRRNKATLSASMATEHLLRATSKEQTGPTVAWTTSKTSATLKVRGLGVGQAKKLNSRIEAMLQELGLIPEIPETG